MAGDDLFPATPSDIATAFSSVPRLEKLQAEGFQRMERSLFSLLRFYTGTLAALFQENHVPNATVAGTLPEYSLADILERPTLTEDRKRTNAANEAALIKTSTSTRRFTQVLWQMLFPAEVLEWPEWETFQPLKLYQRVKQICLGSLAEQRLRLTKAALASVGSNYTPDSLRAGVATFTRHFSDLRKNVGDDTEALQRAFLEYYVQHGHSSMVAHLAVTNHDVFAADFDVDKLVSSFTRSRPSTRNTAPLVKALDTGIVGTVSASDSKQSSPPSSSGGGGGGQGSDKAKKKKKTVSQQFQKDGVFNPAKQGPCEYCHRDHTTSQCRALNWLTQVFTHFPESALVAMPAGSTLTLADGKQYTKASNYSVSPVARDTGVLPAPSPPRSGIEVAAWKESSSSAASAASAASGEDVSFLCDTGADMTMTSHAEWFHSLEPVSVTITFGGKESSTKAVGMGTIKLRVAQAAGLPDVLVTLTNVLFVPELADDLLSPKAAYASGALHVGSPDESFIAVGDHRLALGYDQREDLLLRGRIVQAMERLPDFAAKARVAREHSLTPAQFHRAFGHRADVVASADAIANVTLTAPASDEDDSEDSSDAACPHDFEIRSCETCLRTQMRRKSFPKKALNPATAVNEAWVIDNVPNKGGIHGETNILVVLDEFSRYPLAFLPTFTRFAEELVPIIERLFRRYGAPIVARSDGEFVASDLYKDLLKRYGVNEEATVAYSPQQNGIAEARQGHFTSKMVALLSESRLPRSYWPWAAPHAAAVISMCSTKKNSGEPIQSPYIAYFGKKPEVLFPQPWGALCFVLQRKGARGGKMADSALPAVFLGHPLGVKGGIVQYADGRVDISHDIFFPSKYEPGQGAVRLGLVADDCDDSLTQDVEQGHRFSREGADWSPDDSGLEGPLSIVREAWLGEDDGAGQTSPQEEASFPDGPSDLSRLEEESSPMTEESQQQAAPRRQPAAPIARNSGRSRQEERSHSTEAGAFSYSELSQSSVTPGSVIGTTSRGRATRKPSNFWEATNARSARAADDDDDDDDDDALFGEPFVEEPVPDVPSPPTLPPLEKPFDVHCLLSIAHTSSQSGPDAEPVYYFRHTPGTMNDVNKCAQKDRYYKALEVEMENIFNKGVVRPAVMPDGEEALDSFTFFRDKFSADGTYEKTKCRHVVRGDRQNWWQYDNTFADTLQPRHFRTFIALCAAEKFQPFAMDFKSAFLQIPMKERMFLRLYKWMEPFLPADVRQKLADLRSHGVTNIGLEMLMTVYGCRQGPHNLDEAISGDLRQYGLTACVKAPCLWYKKDDAGRLVLIVGVFADDVATAGVPEERQKFVDFMENLYDIGSDEAMTSYIGYMVKRDPQTGNIHLSMPERILQALDRFNILHATSRPTPMAVTARPLQYYVPKADSDEAAECAKLPYAQLVGLLNYLSQTVRPDILVATRLLSSFSNNPGLYHWKCAKRVLRYLKGTRHLGLCYRGGDDVLLRGNSDASHGGNCHDSRTFSGYFTLLAGAPINWNVHKQDYVPVSTGEAEFIGLHHLAKDAVGFRHLLAELGYSQPVPTPLQCDNTSAIQWAYRRGRVDKIKHIRMKYHKVQEFAAEKQISVAHLKSADMPADMLTKVLPKVTFEHLRAFVMA